MVSRHSASSWVLFGALVAVAGCGRNTVVEAPVPRPTTGTITTGPDTAARKAPPPNRTGEFSFDGLRETIIWGSNGLGAIFGGSRR